VEKHRDPFYDHLVKRQAAMGLQTALASALLYGSMQQSGLLSVTDLTRAPAWSLTNANGSVSVSNAALPAYVLEVLEKRNIIPDPLQRWVALPLRAVCVCVRA
jgi:hypothetical protein